MCQPVCWVKKFGSMVDTSATEIRFHAGEDAPLYGIPDSVRDYIREHALYTERDATS